MRRKSVLLALAALCLVGVAGGCGSSGGTLKTATGGRVTRANEGSFSQDALIIASEESTDGWVSATVAAQVDGDLTRIRANTSAVTDIHARGEVAPDEILVEVPKTASWYGKWASGNILTGVSAIDALSQGYHATAVSTVMTFDSYAIFKVTFADILSVQYVAAAYKNADAGIQNAFPDYLVGGGDDITRQVGVDFRAYTFSHGWDDCPAGCINHHLWKFTLLPTGEISVGESGTPL